ncbi:MAG: pyridoxamine 5'-phosphate oxidase family protein [Pseudomonadota bacterium]|nr:pyridoxamine 5'-phosphate oxidase family protein [Pseudomonadota bacterium]
MSKDPSNDPSTDPIKARETLWGLIKDIRFAMFTTHHANGHLHARPMTTQNSSVDEDSNLWFFMSKTSEPVADLAVDTQVNVSYADPHKDAYVSVSGIARVVDDLDKKKQLWNTFSQAWFPGGATDPDLALVCVRISHANYWDVKESKIVQLIHMAQAAVSGKPPTHLGEHAEIRMN